MKIVDEKGRVFGRLNIIDLLVILLILAAGVFLALKITGRAINSGGGRMLTYTVKVEGVEPEAYDNVQKILNAAPSKLMASGEMLPAEVKGVTAVPHRATASVSTTTGALVLPLDDDLLDLTFVIEAEVANAVTNAVGTQEVRIGKRHIVKTVEFEFENGVILSCEWKEAG